ncbi:hypothetical protein ACNFNZ_14210 [Empedobacter brevis]
MRTFLVERFTAKRFLFRFLRSKNEKEEILRQAQNDKIRKTLSVKLNKTYASIVVKDRIDNNP